MNYALQKTLELLIIIGLGLLLQKKVAKQDLKGIKVIILSIALPATIFVALLKIELNGTLLMYPFLALLFNLLLLVITKYFISVSLSKHEDSKKRTLTMLLPSLAPGLSCFPFIVVYLGDDSLALAALADVGNKIFVLILLYLLAVNWYNSRALKEIVSTTSSKLKSLLLSMLNEPINMVIIIALLLLGFGFTLSALPGFIENTITKMSLIMTPLILLFIGMAVRIKSGELKTILNMLVRRSGFTFLFSAVLVYIFPVLTPAMILLLVVFPQSSCSFWPFAHMNAINSMEEKDAHPNPTFDINFAINVLACSLPFSTILIIAIFSFSEVFIDPDVLLGVGLGALGVSYAQDIFKSKSFKRDREKQNSKKSTVLPSKLTLTKHEVENQNKEAIDEAEAKAS